MKRRAYHHLILPDGSVHNLVVVEFDEQYNYVSHHPLQGEEAFVEWVGGTLNLSNQKG
ncbi:MAG: hypothetical protein J6Y04_03160 [Bacteroidaceae bacterium]|nr:hypothetical protein [Bacteroidaceae bacterium]